jgi:hypothetical protein
MTAHFTTNDCEGWKSLDAIDDNMFWNDSEGDGDDRSEREEDDGTDCENGDSATDW